MISAIDQADYLIFCACLAQLLFGFAQTVFLNAFAAHKRTTKAEHFYKKPGRQGLEVLRTTNLALWLVNTFLLENTETKQVHWETFGHEGWTILSNIFQPLTILYHFHAMVCYAEVIAHSYSSKYIGLQRPSKQPQMSHNPEETNVHNGHLVPPVIKITPALEEAKDRGNHLTIPTHLPAITENGEEVPDLARLSNGTGDSGHHSTDAHVNIDSQSQHSDSTTL